MVKIASSVAILVSWSVWLWTGAAASSAYLAGSRLSVLITCPTVPGTRSKFYVHVDEPRIESR